MLEDVVEREEAAHEHLGRGASAVADVLGAERAVEAPGEDPAHAADPPDAGHGLFGGHAPVDQGVDAAPHLFGVRIREPCPLGAGEHAAVEAGERDPLGPASRPAERLERRLAPPEMGDHRSSPVTSAWSACR